MVKRASELVSRSMIDLAEVMTDYLQVRRVFVLLCVSILLIVRA